MLPSARRHSQGKGAGCLNVLPATVFGGAHGHNAVASLEGLLTTVLVVSVGVLTVLHADGGALGLLAHKLWDSVGDRVCGTDATLIASPSASLGPRPSVGNCDAVAESHGQCYATALLVSGSCQDISLVGCCQQVCLATGDCQGCDRDDLCAGACGQDCLLAGGGSDEEPQDDVGLTIGDHQLRGPPGRLGGGDIEEYDSSDVATPDPSYSSTHAYFYLLTQKDASSSLAIVVL